MNSQTQPTHPTPMTTMTTPPATARPGELWTNPIDGTQLVFVPGGPFWMGSNKKDVEMFCMKNNIPSDQVHHFMDETPCIQVTVSAFWISRYPITHGQFLHFAEKNPQALTDPEIRAQVDMTRMSAQRGGVKPFPFHNLTWHEANAYVAWAGMSLPAEAEWEKAARGDDRRVFPWGNEWVQSLANTRESSGPMPDGVEVDRFPGNVSPFGCFQMAGNVSEWCQDLYEPTFYASAASRQDPVGPPQGQMRVLRGGGTTKPFVFARNTSRDCASPEQRPDFGGAIRPVLRVR